MGHINGKTARTTISTIRSLNLDCRDRALARIAQDMGEAEVADLEGAMQEVHHKTTDRAVVGTGRINIEMRAERGDSKRNEEEAAGNKTEAMIGIALQAEIKVAIEGSQIGEIGVAVLVAEEMMIDDETTGKMTGGEMTEIGIGGGMTVIGSGIEIGTAEDERHHSPCTTMYQMHDAQRQLDGSEVKAGGLYDDFLACCSAWNLSFSPALFLAI